MGGWSWPGEARMMGGCRRWSGAAQVDRRLSRHSDLTANGWRHLVSPNLTSGAWRRLERSRRMELLGGAGGSQILERRGRQPRAPIGGGDRRQKLGWTDCARERKLQPWWKKRSGLGCGHYFQKPNQKYPYLVDCTEEGHDPDATTLGTNSPDSAMHSGSLCKANVCASASYINLPAATPKLHLSTSTMSCLHLLTPAFLLARPCRSPAWPSRPTALQP
ncbi:hypothetical protein GUJ93_ZPchr0002g25707 [Zizania palustris]|uniref:Uncharacterized protein n=1 Tax=Zizania palustris TaxID=103762 RepID=A0A8J5SBT6_ZIZPA|nr:hypothetical protein GUJ93_ZPchr0002g25707 [Zizania palustris]